MKNSLKIMLLGSLIAVFAVTSCGSSIDSSSISISELDPATGETISEEHHKNAQERVAAAISNMATIDEIRTRSKIKNLQYEHKETKFSDISQGGSKGTTQGIKGSFQQDIELSGLTSKKPNNVKVEYHARSIDASIVKNGINPDNPNNTNHVKMKDGAADVYLKDNLLYYNIDNEPIRKFMPHVYYASGDFETFEAAKTEAKKVPDRFFDPTPVLSEENLPLTAFVSRFKEEDMIKVFNMLVSLNEQQEADMKFMSYRADKKDLIVNIDLQHNHIREIVVSAYISQHPDTNPDSVRLMFDQFVKIYYCEFNFVVDFSERFNYFDMKIGGSIQQIVTPEGELRPTGAITDEIDINIINNISYDDIAIDYPKDINKYEEFDIVMPEMPSIPQIS